MRPRRARSSPTNITDILNSLLSRKKLKKKIEDCMAFELWSEVVGDKIARHTEPLSLRKGVLRITVSDHAWIQQLQFLKEEIRGRLNQRLKKDVIENIFFQLGEIHEKDKEEPLIAEKLKKVRLAKNEKEGIEEAVRDIKDEGVKDAVKKAMIKEAKRRKLEVAS